MSQQARQVLETFHNQYDHRDYSIEIVCPEFTSLCPKTGQPDFGVLTFTYTPDKKCVELKSLKLYLQSYRDQGVFYENATNQILDDLVSALAPRRMKLVAAFSTRGGMRTNVTATYEARAEKGSGLFFKGEDEKET
jgi:7-cyano-7-deazaguanine reductase